MKILSLSIQNFLIIGEANINLNNRGLMLVQGINEDDSSANSNGAGKSSIVDAISWCLYGETARGVSGDDVINEQVGKNCQVSVIVEDVGEIYHIIRHRKHHEHKNDLLVYKNSPTEPPLNITAGTTALTQELISNIVGCSHEVFVAAVYSGQEQMPDLPGMTDKQLKFIVEEGAGIERLQKAHDLATIRAKSLQSEYDSAENLINSNKAILEREKSLHEKLLNDSEEFRKSKVKELLILAHEKKELEGKKSLLPSPMTVFEEVEVNDRVQKLLKQIEDSQGAEKKELNRLSAIVSDHERLLGEANIEVKIATDDAKRAKSEFETVEARVGTPCKECGKEYCEDDISDARKNAEVKLREKLLHLKKRKEIKEAAEKQLAIAQNERAEFSANMTDVAALVKLYDDLRQSMKDSEDRGSAIDFVESNIALVESKINAISRQMHESPFEEMIDKKVIDVGNLENDIKSLVTNLEALNEKLTVAKSAADVFGRAGVRAHILDTVTPFLNEKTAEYLGTLTDGNIAANWSTLSTTSKGELRERFGISVSKRNGSQTFKGLSGGEKRKVRLATAMALQDLVASRATKPIEFVLWDEIDDAIDASGLERLMTILEQKGREKGTALVISHNDLNSYIDVGMTVINRGGISEVIDGE